MIEQYTPQRDLSRYWPQVRDFVVACMLPHAPESMRTLRTHLAYLSAYSVWLWQRGTELTPTIVFNDDIIALYVRGPLLREQKRNAQYRYRVELALRYYADAMIGTRGTIRLTPDYTAPPPYSPRELRTFLSAADAQATESRRRNYRAALALGAGAGLLTTELFALRVADVQPAEHGYLVKVSGQKPRDIPLHRDWCATVEQVIGGRRAEEYVGWAEWKREPGQRLGRSLFPERQDTPDVPRLRTTWILNLLGMGLPVPVLFKLTRLESYQGLAPYYDLMRNGAADIGAHAARIAGFEAAR